MGLASLLSIVSALSSFVWGYAGASEITASRFAAYYEVGQRLILSDGAANDYLGDTIVEIAGDGSRIAVGSDGGREVVYVLARAGKRWAEEARLRPSDSDQRIGFSPWRGGLSMSENGSCVVVGAPYDGENGARHGSAYVFVRSGRGWVQEQKLVADDAAAFDEFGMTVVMSADGTRLAVAAPGEDSMGSAAGAVYIFSRSGTKEWKQEQKITAADGATLDGFGDRSLAMDEHGSLLAVGACGHDSSRGAAYVFSKRNGAWGQVAKLSASDGAPNDRFCNMKAGSMTPDGVRLAVAAERAKEQSGAVYVFSHVGRQWVEEAKLTARNSARVDYFGYSAGALDAKGEVLAVGAPGVDEGGKTDAGATYVFRRSGGLWTEIQRLTPTDGLPNDSYGSGVALSRIGGAYLVVTGPGVDIKGNYEQGAMYVYGKGVEGDPAELRGDKIMNRQQ